MEWCATQLLFAKACSICFKGEGCVRLGVTGKALELGVKLNMKILLAGMGLISKTNCVDV